MLVSLEYNLYYHNACNNEFYSQKCFSGNLHCCTDLPMDRESNEGSLNFAGKKNIDIKLQQFR